MRVSLHAEDRAELREARRWYYERSPLSATAFAHAIDNAVSKIVEAPKQYPWPNTEPVSWFLIGSHSAYSTYDANLK
jgi:plasmid stabilization system protein ParE